MSLRLHGTRVARLQQRLQDVLLRGEEDSGGEPRPIPRRANCRVSPLSFAQERILLLHQLNPGSYLNRQFGVHLLGELAVPVLEQALSALLCRHEILRATFPLRNGEHWQAISPDCSIRLPLIDLTDWPESQRERVASRLAEQAGAQPFDLHHGPLLRAKLLRLRADDHILIFTAHQIVMDAWSKAVLLDELLKLYKGEQLPEPPIQYADYAVWQRERVKGRLMSRELRYWSKQLDGAPALLELPADRLRQAVRSYRGERVPFQVNLELTGKLREVGLREDCTLFITLLAAFQTLLHRYTGCEDIVVGAPVANRNRNETEHGIGGFSNTLPLRTPMSGDPSFRELLARILRMVRSAYEHQDFPFEKLVEKLGVRRDPSFAPLFQHLFEFEHVVLPTGPADRLKMTPFQVQGGTTEFDLTLHLEETGDGLAGWFEFATDLFDRSTIERLSEHYATLLAGIVAKPEMRLSSLPLLSAEERAWQRAHFDRTTAMLPPAVCVHELIREQTVLTPNAVAVEYEGQQLTYAELDLRSERLARVLSSLDIGSNDIVALCVDRSLEMVVAMTGVLKAGAAYLQLDPDLPEEQLVWMIRDAAPRALLTMSGATRNLSYCRREAGDLVIGLELPMIYLDAEVWEGMADEGVRKPRSYAGPEDLAYVVYSQDSAGRLKGVQIPHRAFANLVDCMQEKPGIRREDTLLAVSGVASDMASVELLLPLTVGGRVVLASDEALSNGAQFVQLFEEARPTIMQATPAAWRFLIEAGWQGHGKLKILCGGESWSEDLAEKLLHRCGSLWNMYGRTETCIWSAVSEVKLGEAVVIGEPIANTSFHILDQHRQPVPVGVPGELYIGGDGVGLGYLDQSGGMTRSFMADPFRAETGSRLYRTGDRVRYRAAGGIELLGRMNSRTEIGGFHVEPGEIETVLLSHPSVAQAVVIVRDDIPARQQLVAYIVTLREQTVTSGELEEFLRYALPEYMVPSAFVMLRLLPTMSNGKVDLDALPTPNQSRPCERENPGNALEGIIQKIWQEVLGCDHVGLHDDFFELGGHSLLVVRVHQRLREILGREIPIVSLFQNTTIGRLSDFLGGFGRGRDAILDFERANREEPVRSVPETIRRQSYDPKGRPIPHECKPPNGKQRHRTGLAAASMCP